MTEKPSDYELIMEEIFFKDGIVRKVGFQEGKWIVKTKTGKVAILKNDFLLYFECNENGQSHSYQLYTNFAEMAADDVDFAILNKVAAAISAKKIC